MYNDKHQIKGPQYSILQNINLSRLEESVNSHTMDTMTWINNHVFLTKSFASENRFAHILVDESNVCSYFESKSNGKASDPLRQRIATIRKMVGKWPDITNELLNKFDDQWIQRDSKNECYLYFANGTVKISKTKVEFLEKENRPMIWESLVLKRNYKPCPEEHEIVQLAKQVVVDYEALQIGIGYLLHRYWSRNMTKIVWAVDHKPMSQHDGRRGKDLFTTLVRLCRKWVPVKWKRGSNFWTSNIQPDTAICHFEDVNSGLATDEEIKKCITNDLNLEHKGQNITEVSFEDKPKFSASSQSYPDNYMDQSIRGRIWLIEFTDYLQKNPPTKTMVYEDSDLSSFDAWMIECVQCYFNNMQKLIGTSELTDDQIEESLKVRYGSSMIEVVNFISETIHNYGHVRVSTVQEELGITSAHSKQMAMFNECYQAINGCSLKRKRLKINADTVPVYFEERVSLSTLLG